MSQTPMSRAEAEVPVTNNQAAHGSHQPATDRSVGPGAAMKRPRLGFMGTGWIGRLRMEALLASDSADFSVVYDPAEEAAQAAASLQAQTRVASSYEALLDQDIDGVVVATPSALHAEHCLQALAKGKAVFCQKPLARNRAETEQILSAARAADKLLAVDFSYRHLAGMERLREMIRGGELGNIYAANLIFHNAYGPDKSWFYDVNSAGGGCVMDLGIHLVDSLFWLLGRSQVEHVESRLYRQGRRIKPPFQEVEDFATATLELGETHARLCCSWNLHAGQDAVIEANLYGTHGGASIRNVGGSFFDFEIHRFAGTAREKIAGYPDDWGGRALSTWVHQLSQSDRFDCEVEQTLAVADTIDRIYCR
ncbi:Gfo/Idh/MocA family protein [Gilvimarinus sp. F26214L]|uniref:Gfo/Idh/MocA family protein n=1 Tax=Gilvimarinus sp. DZF01 TaxID=3461371 RepID=UPI0040463DC4